MIPVENAHLYVAARSHAGMTGKNNEDQFSVTAYQLSAKDDTPALFAMIADGIGGHQAGEVAAELAVEIVTQAVAESDGSQPTEIMQAGIMQASRAIDTAAVNDASKQGMGTTSVCAWIIGDRLYIASVGNSRLYLIRPGELKQLNVDHTWVQEAVDAGALTPEQARSHPNANIIRRYLGSRQQIEVDLRLRLDEDDSDEQGRKNQGLKLLPGDRLLLCSDGLTDLVEDGEIFNLVKTNALQGAVKSLVDLANANGGKDNITAVALEMPGGEHQWEKDRKEKPGRLSCARVFAIGLIALIALGLLGWYAFRSDRNPSPISPTPTVEVSSTDSSIVAETPDTLPEIPLQTPAPGIVSPPTAAAEP